VVPLSHRRLNVHLSDLEDQPQELLSECLERAGLRTEAGRRVAALISDAASLLLFEV
jgi:hypothetical protein